jgi:3-isopropylmalate/(R)-2-methylmalate dehydratase small subunit
MIPFTRLRSQAVFLDRSDIDTDQIIPARFLTQTTRGQMADAAFADWPERPQPGRTILVAGPNFGCGSSREHAAWALADFGFRVILAPQIADIFFENAWRNGILALAIDPALLDHLRRDPDAELQVDLDAQLLEVSSASGSLRIAFSYPAFPRNCLLRGLDPLDFLLESQPEYTRWRATARALVPVPEAPSPFPVAPLSV